MKIKQRLLALSLALLALSGAIKPAIPLTFASAQVSAAQAPLGTINTQQPFGPHGGLMPPQPGALKSGYIPPACSGLVNSDYLVDCWLAEHPAIAQSIVWWFQGDNQPKHWTQWHEQSKQQLRIAVKNARLWYQNGMRSYPGTLVQDPPTNLTDSLLSQGLPAYETYTREDAWGFYLGDVGLSLAAEIYAFVPWSLRNYNTISLNHLFNAVYAKRPYSDSLWASRFWPSEAVAAGLTPGYINWGIAPANATYTFKFLKRNDLLAPTPKETVARLLKWSQRLWHHLANNGSLNSYNHWQYYGGPTVSRVIEGTIKLDAPEYGVRHWTQGCGGTSAFLVAVLRAANIPATTVNVGDHASIWFSGEKLFLSHGDDPYNRLAGGYPAAELLINEQTYFDWFINLRPTLANLNVGRRTVELATKYPGDDLVKDYCQDVQSGADHASGKVYSHFKWNPFNTVAWLEAQGLWDNIQLKAEATGACYPNPN